MTATGLRMTTPGRIEPQIDQASRLQDLIDQAHRLSGSQGDPKLAILLRHLTQLLDDGYDPVVFCRYVATAHYVGDHLRGQLDRVEVEVVTGELTPEERRERIEAMADAERRILVATDCLSEGINLQHPLVTLLAEHLLEASLHGQAQLAARCAVTLTDSVEVVTTLYLLRLRHQLSYVRRREPFQLMAEETLTLAVRGRASPEWLTDETVGQLLECVPSGNLAPALVERELSAALDFLRGQSARLEALAHERAQRLLEDHRRVREAARDIGQYSVSPCLPVDLMGVYVLLPDSL